MKSKLLVSLTVVAPLVVGFFLGRWQVRHTLDSYLAEMSRSEVQRATAEFSKAAGVLKAVRAGDTNQAIESLESELDTQIIYVGAITEATPISQRDKQWLSRLRWLRDYRAVHPRKSDPLIDEQVAHYLSLVETNR